MPRSATPPRLRQIRAIAGATVAALAFVACLGAATSTATTADIELFESESDEGAKPFEAVLGSCKQGMRVMSGRSEKRRKDKKKNFGSLEVRYVERDGATFADLTIQTLGKNKLGIIKITTHGERDIYYLMPNSGELSRTKKGERVTYIQKSRFSEDDPDGHSTWYATAGINCKKTAQ